MPGKITTPRGIDRRASGRAARRRVRNMSCNLVARLAIFESSVGFALALAVM
jgi:hypothetical protein